MRHGDTPRSIPAHPVQLRPFPPLHAPGGATASSTWCSSPTASACAPTTNRRATLETVQPQRGAGAADAALRPGADDQAYRVGDDRLHHLQRALPHRPQVRLAGPHQRRAGRVERRHLLVAAGGVELQPRRPPRLRHAVRPREAEFVEVVTGLWDSWEPDAFTCTTRPPAGSTTRRSCTYAAPPAARISHVRGPLSAKLHAAGPPDPRAGGGRRAGAGDRGRHTPMSSTPPPWRSSAAQSILCRPRRPAHGRRPGATPTT